MAHRCQTGRRPLPLKQHPSGSMGIGGPIRMSSLLLIVAGASSTKAPVTTLTITWLVSSALGLAYLASLELLMRRLRGVAPLKYAELGSPTMLRRKARSGDGPPSPARTMALLRFLLRRRYRDMGDRRLSQLGHLALACLFFSFAAMIGLVVVALAK